MDFEGWQEVFPGCFDVSESADWFFDHSASISLVNMGDDHVIANVVKETFQAAGLRSITYHQAAIKAVHAYKNLVDRHAINNLPEAIAKILFLPMVQIFDPEAKLYLMVNSSYYQEWTPDRSQAHLMTIQESLQRIRQLSKSRQQSQDALEFQIAEGLPSTNGVSQPTS